MSRFVSAGGGENPGQDAGTGNTQNDDAWVKARAEVELAKRNEHSKGQQQEGKSLYEVLQANQAAKQEAFEESIRLKNQFRTLDEDEVDFLDSVLESTRAKEAAVRQETSEQLDLFRKQQEDATKSLLDGGGETEAITEGETWTTAKKRRRKDPGRLGGVKLRKSSSGAADAPPIPSPATAAVKEADEKEKGAEEEVESLARQTTSTSSAQATSKIEEDDSNSKHLMKESQLKSPQMASNSLGLSGYSSDSD